MIRALINRFAASPPSGGGSAEAALSFEGISSGWAFLLLVALCAAVWWGYRKNAPGLSPWRRGFLTALRALLAALFVLLLTRPVLNLTLNDPVREKLLVLLDDSESMTIHDQRATPEDLSRAALAANLLPPDAGLKTAPTDGMDKWKTATRADLLRAVTTNDRLNLWSRLEEKADLHFYRFGRDVHDLGAMPAPTDAGSASAAASDLLRPLTFQETATAFGDSIQQLLEENRGQPVAGILLVTDGANNTGAPPEEIAELARQAGVPIYPYGVGITGPRDIIVRELAGPRGAFLKERAEFSVRVRAPGYNGQTVTLRLRANGREVDHKDIRLTGDSEGEYRLGFEPQEKGEVRVEASIDPQEGESSKDNNVATTRLRVLDNQVKVLYVEQEPRWDFRYLLSTLQRDRRLSVKCVLFDGGADLAADPNSGFLKEFPATREELVDNEIIILGDVDPAALGEAHMKLLNEWVGEMGGGLIFMAGSKQDPIHYAGTPLAPLLPVDLNPNVNAEQWAVRSRLPIPLQLTPTGELSPLLRLSDNRLENEQLWNEFQGVRWIARVARAKPTASVYLEAATDKEGGGDAPPGARPPVLAQQAYGKGTVMYFGFDETYHWRSRIGEKYYTRIWNQIIQGFSLERQLGASARTQLKVARPEYAVGEKVTISGRLYTANFAPLTDASVPGTLTVLPPPDAPATARPEKREVSLLEVPDAPGEYSLDFVARAPGEYRFSTILDPNAVIKFEVVTPKLEQSQTALDASLLQTMAQISGGKFVREEDLHGLPDLIASRTMTVPTFKKRELFYSPWWMAALMVLAVTEWLFRRLWQLQ